MRKSTQSGFTLLELIIVMAIIGALMGIAVPQYTSYKERSERASMTSESRSLYRAFVVYYLEYQEYPLASTPSPHKFDPETFAPLSDDTLMGGLPIDIDLELFRDRLNARKAEKFDSPDDMGTNQEFYLILPWGKDPKMKFVVASSDNIKYADGTVVDGGNWLDGVFATRDGKLLGL